MEQKNDHKKWNEKEAKLLSVAKAIYKACSCRETDLTDDQIDNLSDEVYDKMCETCWEKFREKEQNEQ